MSTVTCHWHVQGGGVVFALIFAFYNIVGHNNPQMAFIGSPNALLNQGMRMIPGGAAIAGPLFAGGAVVIGAGIKAAAKVDQENVGLRIHSGRARAVKDEKILRWRKPSSHGSKTGIFQHQAGDLYGLVRPGLNWVVPGTHKMEVISTKNNNIDLANFMVMSSVDRQHEIDAILTIGVVKEHDESRQSIDYGIAYDELIFRALMAAENITEMAQGIGGICTEGLRQILQKEKRPDFVTGSAVQSELIASTGEELILTYGTEIRRLNIRGASYSAADMLVNGRVRSEAGFAPSEIPEPRDAMDEIDRAHIGVVLPGLAPGFGANGHNS